MKLSLSRRIGLFIGCLVFIVAGGLGIVSVIFSQKAVNKEAENGLLEASKQGANYIYASMDSRIEVLEQVADRISDSAIEQQMQVLGLEAAKLGYLDMAVVDMNGQAHYSVSGEIADLSDRDYVKNALNGKTGFSDVMISKLTNNLVIMFAVPIKVNGEVIGALIGRRPGVSLNEITDQISYGKEGKACILGKDGTFFAYTDRSYVLKQKNVLNDIKNNGTLKDLGLQFKSVESGKSKIINYSLKNQHKIAAVVTVPNTNWSLVLGAPQSQITKGVNNLRNLLVIIAVVFIAVGLITSVLLGMSISRPIINVVALLKQMAQYDMTTGYTNKAEVYTKRKDEIGIMANATLTLHENLRNLVENIALSAEQIAASSEELTATSQQSVLSANEVAGAIQQMASGASDQAVDTEKGASNMDLLGKIIEGDQKLVADLNESTNQVEKLKNEGTDILQVLISKTDRTNQTATDVRNTILMTNDSAKKIEAASQMIQSIAEQTNLLALNAAIEAARAGEAGKGFSVVADEIRKLAEQSNGFSSEIMKDIEELSEKSEQAVEVMDEVNANLKEQTESVNTTSTKFEGIADAIENLKKLIAHLNQSSVDMGVKKDELLGIIENLSAISEENAASTEESAASIEEQTASMQEIAGSSESLSLLAQEMQKGISKFNL